jgi:hypothetical protein
MMIRGFFGPDDSLTQDVMYDPGMQAFHRAWAAAGYPLPFEYAHTADERQKGSFLLRFVAGAGVMLREHVFQLGLATAGLGSTTAQGPVDAVGGTIGSLDAIRVYDAGDRVTIEVHNTMSWYSAGRVFGSNRSVLWWVPLVTTAGALDCNMVFRWTETKP